MISNWILITSSFLELILLVVVIVMFLRLKKSEALMIKLKQSQKDLMDKLSFNAQLEKEIVKSFEERQRELSILDSKLQAKIEEAKKILGELQKMSSSPKFLKEIIIKGYRKGESLQSLSNRTGLSIEEIEWILEQENL